MDRAGKESWLETAGGDIYVRESGGPIHTLTAGGNIQVQRAAAMVSARTAGGRIEVLQANGIVLADNSGGSIRSVRLPVFALLPRAAVSAFAARRALCGQ